MIEPNSQMRIRKVIAVCVLGSVATAKRLNMVDTKTPGDEIKDTNTMA
jgi:hypothetical protein